LSVLVCMLWSFRPVTFYVLSYKVLLNSFQPKINYTFHFLDMQNFYFRAESTLTL